MNYLLLTQLYLPKNDAIVQKDKHYPIKSTVNARKKKGDHADVAGIPLPAAHLMATRYSRRRVDMGV